MLQIIKKKDTSSVWAKSGRFLSIAAALAVSALAILLFGYNPIDIYREIIVGSLGSLYSFKETIQTMIPLLLMALGVTMCFRLQFINIGTEGQFYMGALAAAYVGLRYASLPAAVLLPLMFIAAVIGGGLWCAIPAILKIRLGANETLVTLMMNYIAIKLVAYLQFGPWKDPASMGYPTMPSFSENAILPDFLGIHVGWVIALGALLFMYILLGKTKFGYRISVMGENMATAKYAGFQTGKLLLVAVLIGGGLCGVAGFIQASAIEGSLTYQLSGGLGFTAIIVAWLGRLKPVSVGITSFLLSILLQGCAYIQISLSVPYYMANIMQGIILFFVLGSEFFSTYQFSWKSKTKEVAG